MSLLPENWFSTSAAIALLVGVLPFLKFLHELVSSHKQIKVRNLELLFQAIEQKNNLATRLVVEQQFVSIFKYNIAYNDICTLLSNSNPTRAIHLYKNSLRYLENRENAFTFKPEFKSESSKIYEYFSRPIKNFSLYMMFALPAALLGIVILNVTTKENLFDLSLGLPNLAWYLIVCAFIGLLARLAYNRITDTESVKFADELILTYDSNHVKTIELSLWHNANKAFKSDSQRTAFSVLGWFSCLRRNK
ncbi:hypothetical protein [Vibrio intestinalis]|uniref:hypothetical protein n=1 Tax=Vibrio intestinalis TaxID=2933291 RepID=UPI0021A5B771|nr:hypothetical protein [Vibrio intestinalis]